MKKTRKEDESKKSTANYNGEAMSDEQAVCNLCGEPMPAGETMFKYHGYSGPCPAPPLVKSDPRPLVQEAEKMYDEWVKRDANNPSERSRATRFAATFYAAKSDFPEPPSPSEAATGVE